jgi:hypothetical protein
LKSGQIAGVVVGVYRRMDGLGQVTPLKR